MPPQLQNHTRTSDAQTWVRSVQMRVKACLGLGVDQVQEIINAHYPKANDWAHKDPLVAMEEALNTLYEEAANPQLGSQRRRLALEILGKILREIDERPTVRQVAADFNFSRTSMGRAMEGLSKVKLAPPRDIPKKDSENRVNGETVAMGTVAATTNSQSHRAPRKSAKLTGKSGPYGRVQIDASKPATTKSPKEALPTETTAPKPSTVHTAARVHPSMATVSAARGTPAPPPYQPHSKPTLARTEEKRARQTRDVAATSSVSRSAIPPSLPAAALPAVAGLVPPPYQRYSETTIRRMKEKEAQRNAHFSGSSSGSSAPRPTQRIHPVLQKRTSDLFPDSAPVASSVGRSESLLSKKRTAESGLIGRSAKARRRSSEDVSMSSSSNEIGAGPDATMAATSNMAHEQHLQQAAEQERQRQRHNLAVRLEEKKRKIALEEGERKEKERQAALEARKRKTEEERKEKERQTALEKKRRERERLELEKKKQEEKRIAVMAMEKPKIATSTTDITFDTDGAESMYSGAYYLRPEVRLLFRKRFVTPWFSRSMGLRMAKWEPFRKVEHVILTGLTGDIDRMIWTKDKSIKAKPNTVAAFHIGDLRNIRHFDKIRWSTSKSGQKPNYELLLRMLPCKVDPTTAHRADCHLWPKGTFLKLNDRRIRVLQRKQQSHDTSLWKGGTSHPLDVGRHLKDPVDKQNKIDILMQDKEHYIYSLAVTRIIPPMELVNELLDSSKNLLQRLSLEESIKKATQHLGDVGKFVFSVLCPISKRPMDTPVRGKQCKHWQCYDLAQYISCNANVSGGRWRCASCETFVSYQDLQVCGLTQAALKKFGPQITSYRGRVEYRADKSYHLLPEEELGGGNKKRASATSNTWQNREEKTAKADPAYRPPKSRTPIDMSQVIVIDSD